MHSHWTSGDRIMSYSCHLKRWSFPIYLGGGAAFVKPGKRRSKLVLVLWGRSKYHNSFNIFIWQRWCSLIGCLGTRSRPTAVAFSASDHFPFIWEGELHLSNLERVAPRWFLVLWGWSKYHNSSNVFMWQGWCTLIGRLGAWLCPTVVNSSASDHFPFFWEGGLHLLNLKRVSPRWILVLWGWSKYYNPSNVFIRQR